MKYGVYIVSDDGVPYITPDSVPLNLLKKVVVTGSNSVVATIPCDTSLPVLPFAHTDSEAYLGYRVDSGSVTVTATKTIGTSGSITLTVYLFSTAPQPLPKWGMAIWDANGKCILTNETRVLNDVQIVGVKGDTAQSGANLNITKPGKWAMAPEAAGYLIGVVQTGGGPRPIQIYVGFTAVYNGASTHFYGIYAEYPPAGMQSGNIISSRAALRVIDASRYD